MTVQGGVDSESAAEIDEPTGRVLSWPHRKDPWHCRVKLGQTQGKTVFPALLLRFLRLKDGEELSRAVFYLCGAGQQAAYAGDGVGPCGEDGRCVGGRDAADGDER